MRGMGSSRGHTGLVGLVTQGYGGVPTFVAIALENSAAIRHPGGNSYKRKLQELQPIIIWAKLIEINDELVDKRIVGSTTVYQKLEPQKTVFIEHYSTKIKHIWESLKIKIQRIK